MKKQLLTLAILLFFVSLLSAGEGIWVPALMAKYNIEEMQRMGFWPRREGQPELAADLIQREGELQRELGELRQQLAVRKDPERALREMRKQRMKEAREGREQTKREQAKARHEKALAWHAKRANHVGYLGPGVSGDRRRERGHLHWPDQA